MHTNGLCMHMGFYHQWFTPQIMQNPIWQNLARWIGFCQIPGKRVLPDIRQTFARWKILPDDPLIWQNFARWKLFATCGNRLPDRMVWVCIYIYIYIYIHNIYDSAGIVHVDMDTNRYDSVLVRWSPANRAGPPHEPARASASAHASCGTHWVILGGTTCLTLLVEYSLICLMRCL